MKIRRTVRGDTGNVAVIGETARTWGARRHSRTTLSARSRCGARVDHAVVHLPRRELRRLRDVLNRILGDERSPLTVKELATAARRDGARVRIYLGPRRAR